VSVEASTNGLLDIPSMLLTTCLRQRPSGQFSDSSRLLIATDLRVRYALICVEDAVLQTLFEDDWTLERERVVDAYTTDFIRIE
jgi:hypothetical protein